MKLRSILLSATLLLAAEAHATSCSPSDNTSRILASPSPDDIHPDWQDGSYIGTSWSLEVEGRIENETGSYLKGDLISPKGDVATPSVYVLEDEWDCE